MPNMTFIFSITFLEFSSSMASDLKSLAEEAYSGDSFELAVDRYFEAISLSPKNAQLFTHRAQAHIKLNNFTEAIADTNRAIQSDPLLAMAYLCKGTACVKLDDYQTAMTALKTVLI